MNRVGHAFFKRRMREEDAIFGGEVTGHYYFRDNFYADNGFIPALLILELMSKKGQTLARAAGAAARRSTSSPARSTPSWPSMDVVPAKLEALAREYADGDVLHAGRHLGRVPGLALQRAGVEHRAAAAAEPRGDDAGADGGEARRGAGVIRAH